MTLPKEAQDFYDKSNLYIKVGKFRKAINCLKKALELFPNYAEALSLLGYVHYKLKFKELSKEEVFKLSREALSINDKSFLTWFHMGNANSYLNRFDDAIESYLKAHELGLENEKLWNNLGSAYLKKGDFKKALYYFNKAIIRNPYFTAALNNLGYYYSQIKDYQLANHFLDKAIKLDPNYSAPWNNKGNICSELLEFDKALECYLQGLKIDPDDAHLLNNVGANYYFKKDYDKAIEHLEKAKNANPTYGDPWVNLGAIYSDKNDYEKAIECYEKALQLDSSLFKAWYNKGNVHIKRKEFESSKFSYKKTLDLNPLYAPAWTNLGNIYLANNQFLEAKNCYIKAIDLHSTPIIEWFNLGNVYRIEGSYIQAIKSYQNTLDLNPNYGGAWFNQGISYLMINDLDMAIICFLEAININPDNHGIYGNLGIAYEGKREYDKSIECFQKVFELNPNDSLAITSIGRLHFYKGDFDNAIKYFKKALQLPPNYIVYLKNQEYAIYTADIDQFIGFQGDTKEIINYQSEIWVYLGMVYNQIGNSAEVINCFNKAIELNPEDFITHANLGIVCLNNFEYVDALKNFDLAIKIIKEKDLKKELKKVIEFKKIIEKTVELKPNLEIIDKMIKDLVEIKDIQQVTECIAEIYNLFKELIAHIDIEELYSITKDLLLAKYHIFNCLFDCTNFNLINLDEINKAKEIFASKTKFIKFFFSLQNVIDIVNLFRGYNTINEIPKEIEEQIIVAINNLESLGFDLSKMITGNIETNEKLLEFSPREIPKIIHPGVEYNQFFNEDLETDYKSEFETKKEMDIRYIESVCDELEKDIPKYKNRKLKKSDFLKFINQFPEELQVCMAKLLKKITFITWKDMKKNLINLINNIVEEKQYAYIILFEGARQKSQDAWAYFTKKFTGENLNLIEVNEVPEILSNLEEDRDYYFIFLDDVVLTGTQFVDFFHLEMNDDIDDLEFISNSNDFIHFYLIAGVGSFDSKKYISKNTDLFNEERIRYGITVGEKNKAFSDNNWDDLDLKQQMMKFLEENDPHFWNGFKDSQSLVVLEWNTPDNTIGCLWHNAKDLKALFPRI